MKGGYLPVDFLIEFGAVLVALQFLTPIARSIHKRMYVSLWYISAGLVWLILTYVMGNMLPEWVLPGAAGAAVTGLFIHDLVGLYVTPMGWGLMYFFVPIILRNADDVAPRNSGTLRPGTVDVAVLPPIPIQGWTLANLDERIEQVRQMFVETLENWPAT